MAAVRALFFSSYTGLGGGETSLLALLGAIDRSRIEPLLLCPREGRLTEAARQLDVTVRVVSWRGAPVWFVPSIWERVPAVARIVACVRELEPSVLHSEFHALPYAAAAARRRRLPLVFTCYGWWFRPRIWQRRFYNERVASMLAISDAVRSGFLGSPAVINPEHVQIVPLGVDVARFRPRPGDRQAIRARFGLPTDRPLVTLVARFQNVKGHHVLLDMARHVLRSAGNVLFAVAGENAFGGSADERYRQRILETAGADPVLRDGVRYLGWIPNTEELIAASDVVVCTSLFESFGMVHIEAMACEVPVVSTNVGGPAETVVDGQTGFLVPPSRPGLLAARVLELLADADKRRAFGRAGRKRVIERFSIEQYAATMTEVLVRAARRTTAESAPSA
jgi:glycosyltransferase involved in cell wall biosynthesis